jgi:hypothetical protein
MTHAKPTESNLPTEDVFWLDGDRLIVPAAWLASWTHLTVPLHTAINRLVPIGYQDDTGFHYSEMSVSNAATSLGEMAV